MNLNFAENLKKLRKDREITQEKLAEMLGVTSQSISRWELNICYPDLELLPIIANYFGVTIDSLLSNDPDSKERDLIIFNDKVLELSDDSDEKIVFVNEYCRKYPENNYYSFQLVVAIKKHLCIHREKSEKYMPLMLKHVQVLLETQYRNTVIQLVIAVCPESEMKKWLDMTPYSGFSRRYCLISRAIAAKDWERAYVQQGLEAFESMAKQLDRRYPDSIGAPGKVQYHKELLSMIRTFGDGNVPNGWKLFYAYKQLVLAACLFACGDEACGWENFSEAIETCRFICSLNDEWLEIGGELFAGVKVSRDWNYAIDRQGNQHKLFALVNLSRFDMDDIYDLLSNPRWAWFDSVRQTPAFCEALAWCKKIYEELSIDN